MATMTTRLPDEQHNRLKTLATRRCVSLNKLMEESVMRTQLMGLKWIFWHVIPLPVAHKLLG